MYRHYKSSLTTNALHVYKIPAKFLTLHTVEPISHYCCQVKTATHPVHWLTQILWLQEVQITNITLQFNHSESHSSIVCLHFLLRHYTCLPYTIYYRLKNAK